MDIVYILRKIREFKLISEKINNFPNLKFDLFLNKEYLIDLE